MIHRRLLPASIVLLSVRCAFAGSSEGVDAAAPHGLQWPDWLLIFIYAMSTIGLGVYFSRKHSSTKEYFVGSGNMNPFFIGVSLFATLLSTISYLSLPGEASGKGPVTCIGLFAMPIVFIIVSYVLLPVYMRNRVTSAYELLEARLGLSVRLLGASMFLALRLVWMTLLVYLAAKAMTVMLGADYWIVHLDHFEIQSAQVDQLSDGDRDLPGMFSREGSRLTVASIPVIVLFTGLVSVIYTTLGGLRAVVITDFMQTLLLFGGALMVIAMVTIDFGGFGWFPTTWQPNWDTQPIFSLDPKTRVTMVGTVLSVVTWYVATAGGDQTSVQRFMATVDTSAARRALATQLGVGVLVQLTLFTVGFALLAYFQRQPEELSAGFDWNDDADDLFPQYISYNLPVGVSGLVVAAMFAAAMSSIDSGVNSITAVVSSDLLGRFGIQPRSEKGQLIAARMLALGIGLVVVLGSTFMKYIEGNITAVTNKTVNLLTTPIFGLFVYALFLKNSRPIGAWVGTIAGTAVAATIAFSGPLVYLLHTTFDMDPAVFGVTLTEITDDNTGEKWTTAQDPISFQWISPASLLVNLTVGTLVSKWATKK